MIGDRRGGGGGVYYDIPGYGVFRRTRVLCVPSRSLIDVHIGRVPFKAHGLRTQSDWTTCNDHSVLFSCRSFSIRGVDGVLVLIQHADAYVHLRARLARHIMALWTPVGVLE